MNPILKSENLLRSSALFLLMLAVPTFVLGQHKNESSKPSAPSHSAPAHNAPSSHQSTPSHNAPASHTATTGHATPSTHTTTPGHSAATAHTTTPTHTAPTGRGATNAGRATTGRPNTTAGRPNNAAGRPNTAGRPATAATRGSVGSHTPPGRTVSLKGGGTASVRPNGQIRSINRNGMTIQHNVNGGRTVVSERNGARIVTTGRGGYVQRAYVVRGGRTFVSRTYVYGGVVHVGVYRSYAWGGHFYYGWHPGFYFHPGFYAWGYHPWGAPVYWGIGAWGWGGAPWWGYYGGWWNPYPYYAAPAFWLTDYLISEQLQAAYAARAEARADAMSADAEASSGGGGGDEAAPAAAPAASGGVALTPEVKDAIAEEVKAQLAAQEQQASSQGGAPAQGAAPAAQAGAAPASGEVPPALDPARRTFIVNANVTAVNNGQECGLTGGDVLTRLTDTPDADQTVNVSVGASKKGDCVAGQTVAVKVDDLQEMYNHFQEQLQNGMSELAKKQGTGGIPKAPDTGTSPSDVPPPAADNTAAQALQDQQKSADQTEAQAKQEAAASQGGGTQ